MGGADAEKYLHLRQQMVTCEPTAFNVDPGTIPTIKEVAIEFADSRPDPDMIRYMATVQWGSGQRVAGMIGARAMTPPWDAEAFVGAVGAFYVPNYLRGHNVGRTLLRVALNFLDEKVDEVSLDVSSDNPRAYDFYKRLGFEETGLWYPWWNGSDIQDIVMIAPVALALKNL